MGTHFKSNPIKSEIFLPIVSGVKSVEKYYDKLAEDYEAAVRAWGYCLPEACIDSLVKYAQFDANDTNVTVLDLGCGSGTKNPSIYNIIHWVSWTMGQMNRRPSV